MQEICAGILCLHPSSRRALLGLRNDCKEWSTFGGHFEDFDGTVKNTAIREFKEETLCQTPYKISNEPIYIFENKFLRYYTFLSICDKMFAPTIDQEHSEYCWFKIDSLPTNILPGCKEMFNKKMPLLNRLCDMNKR
jgi:8-oxo-dGTP pyrophosphatase MutT (NUDIX family)